MDITATPIESETTADGTIPQGALLVSIKNVGTATAVVNGVSLPAGEAKTYAFSGKPYNAIPYVTNGTTLRLLRVV